MDRPLRLLGLGNSYAPEVIGGYPEVAADVMEGLARRGHHVTMLVSPRTLPRDAPGPDGSRVSVHRGLTYILAPWRRPVAGLRAVLHDQRQVDVALAHGVDAVLAWHMRGMVKTSLRRLHEAGVPVLYMIHDRWPLYERPGPWLRPWPVLDRAGLRAAREALAKVARPRLELGAPPIERHGIACFVTDWLRDEHARLGFRPQHAHTIRGGFDIEPFASAGRKRPAAIPPRRLVYAGRVDPRKGILTAVEGIARAHLGHELVIAGPTDDDRYRARVERRARDLGVTSSLDWRGPLPRTGLPALFAETDAMIYPSVEPESYGLGLIEAMAAGRPVLTSALGGPREYLRDRHNALLFEPGDSDQLAAALRRLDAEPELARRLAEQGARTATQHSLEPVLDLIEGVLHEAAGERHDLLRRRPTSEESGPRSSRR